MTAFLLLVSMSMTLAQEKAPPPPATPTEQRLETLEKRVDEQIEKIDEVARMLEQVAKAKAKAKVEPPVIIVDSKAADTSDTGLDPVPMPVPFVGPVPE